VPAEKNKPKSQHSGGKNSIAKKEYSEKRKQLINRK
jgi:hypothetical protein